MVHRIEIGRGADEAEPSDRIVVRLHPIGDR